MSSSYPTRESLGLRRTERCVGRLRPPMKALFRETFQAKPESLAVVDGQFERRAGAIAKGEERAGEGILIEAGLAKRDERVNSFAKVDGLVSEQDAESRDKLDHRLQGRRKSGQRVARAAASCGRTKVIRAPSGRSSTRRQSWAARRTGIGGSGKETAGCNEKKAA